MPERSRKTKRLKVAGDNSDLASDASTILDSVTCGRASGSADQEHVWGWPGSMLLLTLARSAAFACGWHCPTSTHVCWGAWPHNLTCTWTQPSSSLPWTNTVFSSSLSPVVSTTSLWRQQGHRP